MRIILRKKFGEIQAYLKKQEKNKQTIQFFYLKELEKKSKVQNQQEIIINIRTEINEIVTRKKNSKGQ